MEKCPGRQVLLFRYLSKYTVFFSCMGAPKKAYGVLGLADPPEKIIGPYLPRLITTVLLPFKGKIIYDGLLVVHNISFGGGGSRSRSTKSIGRRRRRSGLSRHSTASQRRRTRDQRRTRVSRRRLPSTASGRSASGDAKAVADEVIVLTDAFCREFLNKEYAEMCRKMAETLARKRPSPLLNGRLETWACGIVRTVGSVNFLDDRKQQPHLKLPFIDRAFGVAESTGQGKSKTIRTMLKIGNFDPKWTLPSLLDMNPNVWILEVNGFLMDIRNTPREVRRSGLRQGTDTVYPRRPGRGGRTRKNERLRPEPPTQNVAVSPGQP